MLFARLSLHALQYFMKLMSILEIYMYVNTIDTEGVEEGEDLALSCLSSCL